MTGRYRSIPVEVNAVQYHGDPDSEAAKILRANDIQVGSVPLGVWVVEQDGFVDLLPDNIFRQRFAQADTRQINFSMSTKDDDQVNITVEGFERGSSVIHALMHAASPEVLTELLSDFVRDGDLSVVALALELGATFDELERLR